MSIAPSTDPRQGTTPGDNLVCPLCEYDLRGLTEPRCPECGYRFEWEALRDPSRRLHPYLFEHHPEQNLRSFLRTAIHGLRPRKFWTTLHPAQPSRPKRMLLYWCLVVLGSLLPLLLAVPLRAGYLIQSRNADRQLMVSSMTRSSGYPNVATLVKRHGSIQAFVDSVCPPPSPSVIARDVLYDDLVINLLVVFAVPAAWTWLTFGALLVFRWSMSKARVKNTHVLRCALYSSDVQLWTGLLASLAVAGWSVSATIMSSPGALSSPAPNAAFPVTATLVAGVWIVSVYRLWVAYRSYLRFSHTILTVLASQIMVGLVFLKLAFLLGGM